MDWRSQLELVKNQHDLIFNNKISSSDNNSKSNSINNNNNNNNNINEEFHPFPELQHIYSTSLFRPTYKGPILKQLQMSDFMNNNETNITNNSNNNNKRSSIKVEEALAGVSFLESYFNDFVIQAVMIRKNTLLKPSAVNNTSNAINYLNYIQKQKKLCEELSNNMDNFQFERLEAAVTISNDTNDKEGMNQIKLLKDSLRNRCQLLREEIACNEVYLDYLINETNEIVNVSKDYTCKIDFIHPNWSDIIELQKLTYCTTYCRNFEIYMELQSLPICEQVYNFLQSPIKLCNNILCITNYTFEPGEFITIMEYLSNNQKLKTKIHQLIINNCINTFCNYSNNNNNNNNENVLNNNIKKDNDSNLDELLEDYVMFAQCIVKMNNLKLLSLKNNDITDAGIISFMTTINTHSILKQKEKYIKLADFYINIINNNNNNNNIDGMIKPIDYLNIANINTIVSLPPLTTIYLDNNLITDIGCKSICDTLFKINIKGIETIVGEVKAYHHSMVPFPNLNILSLASNPINNNGLYYLTKSLLNNTRKTYRTLPKPNVIINNITFNETINFQFNNININDNDNENNSDDENNIFERNIYNENDIYNNINIIEKEKENSLNILMEYSLNKINIINMRYKSIIKKINWNNKNNILKDDESIISSLSTNSQFTKGKWLIIYKMSKIRAKLFAVCTFMNMWKNRYILNNKISSLNLSNCNLTAPYATKILYLLCKDNKNIHYLNISHNNIGSDSNNGCIDITNLISSNCDLYSLDLSNCNISNIGIEIITSKIKNNLSSKLMYLNLSDNLIGPIGGNWITNKLLDEFFLDRCRIILSMSSQKSIHLKNKYSSFKNNKKYDNNDYNNNDDDNDDDNSQLNDELLKFAAKNENYNTFIDEDSDDENNENNENNENELNHQDNHDQDEHSNISLSQYDEDEEH